LSKESDPTKEPMEAEASVGTGDRLPRRAGDFNMAALWAGLTAFVWYGFGALPLHLEVAGQLGLSAQQSSS